MNHTEHSAKTMPAKTGRFAVPFASLRAKGSGALSHSRVRIAIGLALATLLATAAPALAAPPSEFGEEGTGAGKLQTPQGIAVDQETGDVYLNDFNNSRGDRFGAEGEFKLAFGWGVVDGTPVLQTCGPLAPTPTIRCMDGILAYPDPPGVGQFGLGPAGAAVDDSGGPSQGDVYFNDSPYRVTKFGPQGQFLFMIGGGVDQGGGTPSNPGNLCTAEFLANGDTCGPASSGSGSGEFESLGRSPVAVDSTGTLYVGDNERIQKFSPTGAFEGEIALPGVIAEKIAIDSADDIYVMGSGLSGVHKYDSTGTELGAPRATSASSGNSAITVGASDQLIVAEGGSEGSEHLSAYDSAGNQLWALPGSNQYGSGIAYGEAIERVYAIYGSTVRLIAPPPPGPLVRPGSETAEEVGTTSAKLGASINPEGGEETTYAFQYVDDESFATEGGFASPNTEETTTEELTGGPFEDQAASASLSALQPGTTYHFRVVVTNKASQTATGPDQTFTTLPAVSIDATYAFAVTDTTAILGTELNPHGLPTTYRFEYDTAPYAEGEAAHGTSIPVPDGSAGSSSADVTRTAPINGLAPSTTYHFRVVAENSLGTIEGPDRSFTTQGTSSSQLPDGRQWEMVSPPDKHGTPLMGVSFGGEGAVVQAAADGSGISYPAKGPIDSTAPGSRSAYNSQFLSERGSTGWSTQDISTPHQAPAGVLAGNASEYNLFSSDLSLGAVEPEGTTPLSPQATEKTPYLRQADGTFLPLVTAENVPPGVEFGGPNGYEDIVEMVGGTPDLSHVLLRSTHLLTPDFEPGFEPGSANLFEWSAGSLELVSWIPSGSATRCGGSGPACLPASELEGGSDAAESGRVKRHAIVAGGSRVLFSTFFASEFGKTTLYMRDLAREETIQLDAGEPDAEDASGRADFQDASADGSRVFFTSASRLTPDAGGTPDLYMCQIGEEAGHLSCDLTDLTAVSPPGRRAEVLGHVIGTADDGSSVYYVARGVLSGPNGEGQAPVAGEPNLYRYDTEAESTELVAVLSPSDAPVWGEDSIAGRSMTARVSPNGRYLAFMSQRSLTGYDNRDAKTGVPAQEVYLFDSQAPAAARLVCASCNPSGARPHAFLQDVGYPGPLFDQVGNWSGKTVAAVLPGLTNYTLTESFYQARYLSNSGRLFFNAADALVPQDSNGVVDVYQYEPAGIGDCGASSSTFHGSSGGCVALLSTGTSPEESVFMDASESGDDAFFLTASRLATTDFDGALDVYDAHVCTAASPCPPPPPPGRPVCSGDACQQPAVPPSDATPGSLTFQGAGNVHESKPKKKHRKKKKHHKKKQQRAKQKKAGKRAANHNRRTSR